MRLAATGVDPPAAARERERIDRDLVFVPYAERFPADYGKREWRLRICASNERNMRRWIIPVLGRKALPAITKRDLIELFDRIPATKPAVPRNLFALLRKLFNLAAERGDLDRPRMDTMKPLPRSMPATVFRAVRSYLPSPPVLVR